MGSVHQAVLRAALMSTVVLVLAGCRQVGARAGGGPDEVAYVPAGARQPAPRATGEAAVDGSPFGVFYGLTTYRSRPTTDYMVELGADWTRQTMPWSGVEPKRGQFKWETIDRGVAMVDAAGRGGRPVNILLTLRARSSWAGDRASTRQEQSVPPANLQDFYRFVYDSVKRARGRVRYWQFDNEVHWQLYWGGTSEEYVRLLRTGYRAVKDADPEAKVVIAGIAAWAGPMLDDLMATGRGQQAVDLYLSWAKDNDTSRRFPRPSSQEDLKRITGRWTHDIEFVRRLLRKDNAQYWDVLDLHIYHPYTIIPAVVEWAQAAMAREGYSKPIWITETSGPNYPELWPDDRVGERRQAEEVVKRYALALSSGVERVFWFALVAPGQQGAGREASHMGLLRPDLSKRPAYQTYRLMTQMLKGTRSVRTHNLGRGVQAFEFIGPQPSVYVVWCDGGATVKAPIGPCRLDITDAFGSRTTQEVRGSEAELTLSSTPVFVRRMPLTVGVADPPGTTG